MAFDPAFRSALLLGMLGAVPGCAPTATPPRVAAMDPGAEPKIVAVLDGWHAAAARADEAAYFGALTEDAIFLGTDATERWDKAAFRAFAHPFFARGKAWSFRATERHVILDPGGALAWFDESLATPNLGPSRGSGVARREPDGAWRIAHYNLTVTVPNDRMADVKRLLEAEAAPAARVAALAPMVGAWRIEAKDPATGAPFEMSYRVTPMLDGAWLRGVGSVPKMGLRIEDIWGTDPRSGDVMRVLFDSKGTMAVVWSKGWTGDTLVLEGEASDGSGKASTVRETITRTSANELRAVWEAKDGTSWKAYSVETLRR